MSRSLLIAAGCALGILLGGLGLLGGCAATATEDSDPTSVGTLRPAGPLSAAASTENGLEVQKVVVRDDDERVGAALLESGEPFAGPAAATLERNGFVLLKVDASRIDAVLAELGSPLTLVSTWHGQAPNWREIVRRPARDPVAAVVDGRPRVFSDGALSTQLRAWTVPMEDGAMLELQLRQEFQPVDRGVRLILDPNNEASRGEALGPTVELLMGPGEAWVLSCRLPRDPMTSDADAAPQADSGTAKSTGGGKGPSPDVIFGPSASLPPTLAALLFSSETPATRTLLVFLPRLPSVTTSDRPEVARGLGSSLDGSDVETGVANEMSQAQLGPSQGAAPRTAEAAPLPPPPTPRREGGAFGGGS